MARRCHGSAATRPRVGLKVGLHLALATRRVGSSSETEVKLVRTRAPAVECGPGGQPGRAGQAASAIRHSSKSPWKASKAGGLRIRKWFIHRAPGGSYNRNFHNFLTTQVGLYVYPATRVIWYRRLNVRPIGSLCRSGSFLQEWDLEFGWQSKPTGVC